MKHPYSKSKSQPPLLLAVIFIAACSTLSAVTINFTAAEGYADGDLTTNANWNAVNGNTSFIVDSSGSGSVNLGTANRLDAYAGESFDFSASGSVFTSFIDVQWTQDGSASGATTFAGMSYLQNPTSGTVSQSVVALGRTAVADGYRIAAFSAVSVGIAGADLGIDSGSGDNLSDIIRLTYVLEKGASSSTWTGHYTVTNTTTDIVVLTGTRNNINVGSADTDPAVYSTLTSGNSFSGLSDVNVSTYGITAAVPEPTTYAAITGLLAFIGMIIRKRVVR